MPQIFISYRRNDLELATRLATEIRNAGHKVWFDEWEIELGDSIIARINQGLRESNYLLACFSGAGNSSWCDRELMAALALQLNGHNVKVLPVLLTGGEPPAIMADIQFIDLVKDWSQGVSKLLHAIR